MNLEGKVGIVTGAGRGLGRAYAEALAAAGASVVINDVDADALGEVAQAITSRGGAVASAVAPVGSQDVADALVAAAVSSFGRLDFFVTNAGILRDSSVTKMSEENFEVVLKTHLTGTFACAKAAFVQMREQGGGGALIFIGSPAGQLASFGQANYSAAKAGIVGMARTLAVEGKKPGITVNVVIPVALTRMMATIPGFADIVSDAEAGKPVPTHLRQVGVGVPADVAPMVVFLASDAAKDITGQVFGAGGDRISVWSQPKEVEVAIRDGGWTADDIAEVFPKVFAPVLQGFTPAPLPAANGGAK